VSIVSSACIGKSTCKVSANKSTFGDPCVGRLSSPGWILHWGRLANGIRRLPHLGLTWP
jgi:hypothetical protein